MKLGRVVIPTIATVAVLILGIVTVALVARGVLASEPASDPDPTPTPASVVDSTTGSTPVPEVTVDLADTPREITLELPVLPDKSLSPKSQTTQRSTGAVRSEPPAQPEGKTYSWEDGDRTLNVVLQEDLVVQKTSEVTATDVVVVKGVVDSIVEKQTGHGSDAGPVFKSESGGELMTLPGGVLLALDPTWDETQVENFFSENGISADQVSELDFIPNGFVVETDAGFPSLDLANELASQDGVLISSPNWYRWTPSPTSTPSPTPTPEAEAVFDRLIPELLEEWEVPGAAIAIAKDGKLVLARGYGMANVENEEPVEPDSLFRTASVSKPFTAVAVLQLVENGLLGLEERVFQILDEFQPPEGATRDPRLDEITVRYLLQHSGGWDSDKSYDAMWIAGRVERELGVPKPVSCRDVIRFMLGQPLDFDPGTRYAYSNFGYCLLGRVIEEKTGRPYEEYVRERVLEPLGIVRMRVGGTLPVDRAEGEVTYYYGYPGEELAYSVMPGTAERVPWPYGGFHLKTMDAHGGWIASAIDLVRFATSVDRSRPPSALDLPTVKAMVSRPAPPLWEDSTYYYALGWLVRPVTDDANWWHDGSLPGTYSLVVRTHHGFAWAALFNSRPEEWGLFGREVDHLMWQGVREVTRWPSHDLFPEYGYE